MGLDSEGLDSEVDIELSVERDIIVNIGGLLLLSGRHPGGKLRGMAIVADQMQDKADHPITTDSSMN